MAGGELIDGGNLRAISSDERAPSPPPIPSHAPTKAHVLVPLVLSPRQDFAHTFLEQKAPQKPLITDDQTDWAHRIDIGAWTAKRIGIRVTHGNCCPDPAATPPQFLGTESSVVVSHDGSYFAIT